MTDSSSTKTLDQILMDCSLVVMGTVLRIDAPRHQFFQLLPLTNKIRQMVQDGRYEDIRKLGIHRDDGWAVYKANLLLDLPPSSALLREISEGYYALGPSSPFKSKLVIVKRARVNYPTLSP